MNSKVLLLWLACTQCAWSASSEHATCALTGAWLAVDLGEVADACRLLAAEDRVQAIVGPFSAHVLDSIVFWRIPPETGDTGLRALTTTTAKPAIPFDKRFRTVVQCYWPTGTSWECDVVAQHQVVYAEDAPVLVFQMSEQDALRAIRSWSLFVKKYEADEVKRLADNAASHETDEDFGIMEELRQSLTTKPNVLQWRNERIHTVTGGDGLVSYWFRRPCGKADVKAVTSSCNDEACELELAPRSRADMVSCD